ncbi:MAG: OmpH family outer membrane protein [Candidatus Amulumruptor caecigallinarius]|nr:OmpH family outer membrane protein [Candidatus Amulumruptor caecigallinarius]
MKKNFSVFAAAFMIAATGVGAISCSSSDGEKAKTPAKGKTEKTASANLPNYRYVDLDTILSKYNLAKDYNEEMLRLQTNAESQMKQHQNKLQNFAANVQNKMQNNGYLSEASYKQDQQTYANMENQAQRSMAGLQSNIQQAAMNAQKTINDSINAFIEQYNKTRGYDAILFKAATLYINPELDITDEVIEGLNARYNKVKK